MNEQQAEFKPHQHRHPTLEAILNISRAAEYIRQQVDNAVKPLDITGVQYNILRILKRTHPEGLSRSEILKQLIEKSVDVTRSIDGLAETGLVERIRTEKDRRLSISKITETGIQALEQVDPLFYILLNQMTTFLNQEEYTQLSHLCEKLMRGDIREG